MLLTAQVQDEQNLCRKLIIYLAEIPTHLMEIIPPHSHMDKSDGRVVERNWSRLQNSKRECFVWRLTIGETTSQHILTEENSSRALIINGLEIAAYIVHLQILCPLMDMMNHITKICTSPTQKDSQDGGL